MEKKIAINNLEQKKIILKEYHSKEYIENLRKECKKNKNEDIVFILPNGKEV